GEPFGSADVQDQHSACFVMRRPLARFSGIPGAGSEGEQPMIRQVKSGAELARAPAANRRLGCASALTLAIAAVAAISIPGYPEPAFAAEVNAHGAPHPVGFADIA